MTWIKICGTTNLEDALTAVDAGADAVGFVFCEKSPRNIGIEAAKEIVEQLPEGVEKIGVFVNEKDVNPLETLLDIGLTGTQTYFSTEGGGQMMSHFVNLGSRPDLALDRFLTARFLVPLSMSEIVDSNEGIEGFAARFRELPKQGAGSEKSRPTFVLDSGDLRHPGGTGKTFDWKRAAPLAQGIRQGGTSLVVAGGLTPENVTEAIGILKPWGVDVVSGVEASPGKKDPDKVRAFVKAVREFDRKSG